MKHLTLTLLVAVAVAGCNRNTRVTDDFAPPGVTPTDDSAYNSPITGTGVGTVTEAELALFSDSVGNRVLFPVDQSTLTPSAISTLDRQAAWLAQRPGVGVTVEGHADERGTREYNIALGDRRASAVRDYLVSQGVDAGRIRTVSFGKERPVATCSEETCLSQNRRAVTLVAGGLS